MKFEDLLSTFNNNITLPSNSLPVDSINVATQQLSIVVKNSLQCKIDYNSTDNPLKQNEAIYTIYRGEYVIYYDENHPYKNFYIAHEIAHHLLHHVTDDIDKHHDANLLAAIIVAPPQLIKKSKIKSATELSLTCKIPVEVANTYWSEYKKLFTSKFKYIFSLVGVGVLIAIVLINVVINHKTQSTDIVTTTESTTVNTTETTTQTQIAYVYVTRYGKKYHKPDCFYIQNSNTALEISIEAAIDSGYSPCKVCNP